VYFGDGATKHSVLTCMCVLVRAACGNGNSNGNSNGKCEFI